MLSDRQKGLLESVERIFPNSPHGYCMRHLDENFYRKFKHPELKKLLWQAAYATTENEFQTAMNNMEKINKDTVLWLHMHAPAKHWATCYFEGNRYSHLTSNIAESLNHWIHDEREQPIYAMLETIRCQMVAMFADRRHGEDRTNGILVSTAKNSILCAMGRARRCQYLQNSDTCYEVKSLSTNRDYQVDLEMQTCKCRAWQASGIPCHHAIAVILSRKEDPQTYTKPFFNLESYRRTCINIIMHPEHTDNSQPLPYTVIDVPNSSDNDSEADEVSDAELGILLPPKTKRQPGHPKKRRICSRTEQQAVVEGQPTIKHRVQKCRLCCKPGHSKRTCKEPIN